MNRPLSVSVDHPGVRRAAAAAPTYSPASPPRPTHPPARVVVADDDPRERLELPELRDAPGWCGWTRLGPGQRLPHQGRGLRRRRRPLARLPTCSSRPDEVEAQLLLAPPRRYAVVLGHKWFVDPEAPCLPPTVDGRMRVFADVEKGGTGSGTPGTGPTTCAAPNARCAPRRRDRVAAPSNLGDESGGMDTSLRLGEGHRPGLPARQAGAVFVDRGRGPWHLGPHPPAAPAGRVNDYNRAVPGRPGARPAAAAAPAANTSVPYLEIRPRHRRGSEERRGPGGGRLGARLEPGGPSVTLIGDWSAISESAHPRRSTTHSSRRAGAGVVRRRAAGGAGRVGR